ncbi:MAG TPA: tetratricopeptide repeat protein [Archangium sp.]|nr:tetratricopeptide repeat protein [Archangium sp.]
MRGPLVQGLAHGKPASEEKSGSPPALNGSPALSSPAMSLGITAALPALLWLLSSTPTPPAETPQKAAPGPRAPSGGGKQSVKQLLSQASQERHAGNFERAVELHREALRLEPDSQQVKLALGIAILDSALSIKEAFEAIRLLEPMAKNQRRNGQFWFSLAHGRTLFLQREKAIEAYRHYLTLEPKGYMAQLVRARLQRLEEEQARREAAASAPKEAEPLYLTFILRPDEFLVTGSAGSRIPEKYAQVEHRLRQLQAIFPWERELAIANGGVEEKQLEEVRAAAKRMGFVSVREVPAASLLRGWEDELLDDEFRQYVLEAWTGIPAKVRPPPSFQEVLDGVTACTAAANVPDVHRIPILAQGCSKIPSCARECAEPLSAWANGAPVGFLVGCSGFPGGTLNEAGPHGTVKERTERWFLKRLAGFVRAAQPLGEAGRALATDCQSFLPEVK